MNSAFVTTRFQIEFVEKRVKKRFRLFLFQLEQSLRAQGIDFETDLSSGEPERRILVQQNIELRRKLEEEHQNYKRKLANYQDAQMKQAELVQKLQQKVFFLYFHFLSIVNKCFLFII